MTPLILIAHFIAHKNRFVCRTKAMKRSIFALHHYYYLVASLFSLCTDHSVSKTRSNCDLYKIGWNSQDPSNRMHISLYICQHTKWYQYWKCTAV